MRAAVLSLLLISCASTKVEDVTESYLKIRGEVHTPAILRDNDRRLFIRLETEGDAVICLAASEKHERILKEVATLLPSAHPVYLFVSPLTQFEEILDGIDYRAHAIQIYVPWADTYQVIHFDYSPRISSTTWKAILQKLLEKGVDTAL